MFFLNKSAFRRLVNVVSCLPFFIMRISSQDGGKREVALHTSAQILRFRCLLTREFVKMSGQTLADAVGIMHVLVPRMLWFAIGTKAAWRAWWALYSDVDEVPGFAFVPPVLSVFCITPFIGKAGAFSAPAIAVVVVVWLHSFVFCIAIVCMCNVLQSPLFAFLSVLCDLLNSKASIFVVADLIWGAIIVSEAGAGLDQPSALVSSKRLNIILRTVYEMIQLSMCQP